jgi:dTMP kinase
MFFCAFCYDYPVTAYSQNAMQGGAFLWMIIVTEEPNKGHFITLEGGEGTGKSTQINHLVEKLKANGISALRTREPGGSDGAERIRSLILAAGQNRMGPLTETLLFYAARNDHLETFIRPALFGGQWVVCDRFSDSTRVYQGMMGTISPETLDNLEKLVVGSTAPELTLILDLPVEIGLARAAARRGTLAADGFEAEKSEFHQGLRQGYLKLAERDPMRCVVVDAGGNEADVAKRIWAVVSTRFSSKFNVKSDG